MSPATNQPTIYIFRPNTRPIISYRELKKEKEFNETISKILANVSEIIKQQLAR